GLDLYDPGKDGFIHFTPDEKNPGGIATSQVKDIREDKGGILWFTCWNGSGKGELQKLDPEKKEFITIDRSRIFTPEGKPLLSGAKHGLDLIHKVFIDRDDNVWYATYLGIYKYVPSEGAFYRYYSDEEDQTGISFNNIRSIAQDKYGELWMGSLGGGLNRFNPKTGKFTVYAFDYNNNSSISDNLIRGIYIDKQERIWIGTFTGGVNIIDPIKQEFRLIHNDTLKVKFADKSGQTNKINSFVVADNNLLYAQSGSGLSEYNYQNGKLQQVYKPPSDDYTRMAISYFDGKLYGRRWGFFASFDTRTKKWSGNLGVGNWSPGHRGSVTPLYMCRTKDNRVAVCTYFKGIGYMDTKTDSIAYVDIRRPAIPISHINTSFASFYLLGTLDSGLYVMSNEHSVIRHLFRDTAADGTALADREILLTFKDSKGHTWVSTKASLHWLDTSTFKLGPTPLHEILKGEAVFSIAEDKNANIWLLTETRLFKYNTTTKRVIEFDASLGLLSRKFVDKIEQDKNGYFFLASSEGIVKFKPENLAEPERAPQLLISSVKLFGKDYASDSSAFIKRSYVFDYFNNSISFAFGCMDLSNQKKVRYYYRLSGSGNDTAWVDCGNNTLASFNNLEPGEYTFQVRSISSFGLVSHTAPVRLVILPPFWKTNWFYALCILASAGLIYGYIRYRERVLQKEKNKLERIVTERTAEVVMQKEIIEQKNKEMTDSIHYARTIQEAILPPKELFESCFSENFILFRPKDIVSGDFYWISKHDDTVYYATADCTGHGVPGGFMCMLGSSLLNETVDEMGITEPSRILEHLSERMMVSLKQSGSEVKSRDGMDLSFCRVDLKNMVLTYSGANNGVYIVRNGIITHNDATKQPIGIHSGERKRFEQFEVKLRKGDIIYSYTDGYADQFGGDKGKKLKWSNLEKLILMHWQKPMYEQLAELEAMFEKWKGPHEQVDDVLIIGIKI
ncbi:MAG: two-component regulator propeller domain-containing protein, partial [Bacteroidota bacterium]